jgi:hypothetical protein
MDYEYEEKAQKRVEKLFSELGQLASPPLTDGRNVPVKRESPPLDESLHISDKPETEGELDSLLLRIHELETQLKEREEHPIVPAKATYAPAIIYEKEKSCCWRYCYHSEKQEAYTCRR